MPIHIINGCMYVRVKCYKTHSSRSFSKSSHPSSHHYSTFSYLLHSFLHTYFNTFSHLLPFFEFTFSILFFTTTQTMVTLHEELDMAHKTQQKLDRTVRHVQSLKEMQEKLTLSVLKSRAVDSDIIEV